MEGLEAVHNTKEKEINSVVVESYFYVISLVVLERTNIDYFVVEDVEMKHFEYCYFYSSNVWQQNIDHQSNEDYDSLSFLYKWQLWFTLCICWNMFSYSATWLNSPSPQKTVQRSRWFHWKAKAENNNG